MKGINNRQKMIVKPRESVQKFVLSAGRLKKGVGKGKDEARTKRPRLGKKGSE